MTTKTKPTAEDRKSDSLDQMVKEFRPHTPSNKLKQLDRMGITTVRDLLTYLPRGYENRSRITPATNARDGQRQTFEGYITSARATGNNKGPGRQTATIYDTHEDLTKRLKGLHIIWFGQRHLVDKIRHGDYVRLNGMVNAAPRNGFIQLYQPEMDILTGDVTKQQPAVNTGAIIPMYNLTQGMTQDYMRRIIHQCLQEFQNQMVRSRPGDNEHTLTQILWTLHFPRESHHPALAIKEIASDEILELQMALLYRRQEHLNQGNHKPMQVNPAVAEAVHTGLPFTLTTSQKQAIDEIRKDLVTPGPTMNRLLQGEVGSGKTVVALTASIDTASSGAQTTLLAPTELLAEQHFKTITELMNAKPSPVENGLMQSPMAGRERPFTFGILTASTKATERRKILKNLEIGYIDLIIGTHSLLNAEVQFRELGLAIADEQHRFGTQQRAALRQQAHYLMLTATPIPRTLQLTLYRDLDISSIARDRDPGHTPTQTEVILDGHREPAWQRIANEVRQGQQAFVVCPFIDPSEIPGASVSDMGRTLSGRFPDLKIETVHGRMKSVDQDKHMRAFRDQNTDILVATPVIEVGIDIPNATVMIIESAERFGMAQLHQLRGRIGRGEHPGNCYLIPTPGLELAETTMNRLETTAASNNGLELAEADLHNRGEGQIAGNRQSGRGGVLRTGSSYDLPMLESQRTAAESIHAADPDLSMPENQELRRARDRMLQRLQQEAGTQ